MKLAYKTVYCNPEFTAEADEKLAQIAIGQNPDIDFDYDEDWELMDVEDDDDR